MEKPVLEIANIRKTFSRKFINLRGQSDAEVWYVLDNFNLAVPYGKVTALVGGNGSGKSTLFNIIGNLIKPDKGSVTYYNDGKKHDLLKTPPYAQSALGIGRLFQGTHIFRELTVLENMMIADENRFGEIPFVSILQPSKNRSTESGRIREAEERLEMLLGKNNPLIKKRHESAGALSYGQQRLLATARLFMNDNLNLLLLDEPCAGVNPDIIETLHQLIRKMTASGKTIFLIEHNMEFMAKTSDFCHYLEEGRVHFSGVPAEVLNHETLQKNYLGGHA